MLVNISAKPWSGVSLRFKFQVKQIREMFVYSYTYIRRDKKRARERAIALGSGLLGVSGFKAYAGMGFSGYGFRWRHELEGS